MHGWGSDASAFLFVANKMRGYKNILVDLYGFGSSPHPDCPLTVRDYANGVSELLKALGIKKAVVVGHSFGGRVAIELAARPDTAVSRLVLIDSAGVRPRRGPRYFFRVLRAKLLKKIGKEAKGSKDYRVLSGPMKKTFVNVVNYDQTSLLKHVSVSTAIFWGKKDDVTKPYMAKILKRKIKRSTLFWLENAGHFSFVEQSSRFLPIFKAFVGG